MDTAFLSKTLLFRGASPAEIADMLTCLQAERRTCVRDEIILHAGEPVQAMGLVLSGSVFIESIDLWGNKTLLSRVCAGQMFAETYACIPGEPMMVSVTAAELCELLFLRTERLLHPCAKVCPHHCKLIRNLLQITAQKNLEFSRRSLFTAPKSIRGRLTAYLSNQAARAGQLHFAIPFNRQQLADYLGVDRSALSAELSRMQRDGLLTYHKNEFTLKEALV